ncbi:Panacea domain-containing protein [Corynebacterium pseudodiphtheriticum]|uniref:Panacea domain-containing protein n=1 Tax=Corynebacterium pseudodiphtheriticum TaxID=37637 RepID=UPI00047B0BF4|nr:Panacea domain-containing protein [Corynebacterium pseudodiphtheriticum]
MAKPLFANFEPIQGPSLEVVMNAQQVAALIKNGSKNAEKRLLLTKLMWAADRFSLRNCGRSVSQTSYSAMKLGPVPSRILDLIKPGQGYLSDVDSDYVNNIFELSGANYEVVQLISDPGEDYLSELNKEFIQKSESVFRGFDPFFLANHVSHKYPEWKKHEAVLEPLGWRKAVAMDQIDFFENPDEDHYFTMDADVLAAARFSYVADQELLGGKSLLV